MLSGRVPYFSERVGPKTWKKPSNGISHRLKGKRCSLLTFLHAKLFKVS